MGGENASVLADVTTTGGSGTDAGTYTHTASGTDGNYDLTFVDGALTIDKATATVTANSNTTTYNGGLQNVSGFTATGLVGGENASVLADVTTTGGPKTATATRSATATAANSTPPPVRSTSPWVTSATTPPWRSAVPPATSPTARPSPW
ncbi:MBG domain-containing protein [Halomonas sp. N3-2A]|uniref:MBG domain-containing protein n=1 Tax=Halomonas sp. N3-2A TaxID=2014541 RepID=UPI00406D40FA